MSVLVKNNKLETETNWTGLRMDYLGKKTETGICDFFNVDLLGKMTFVFD